MSKNNNIVYGHLLLNGLQEKVILCHLKYIKLGSHQAILFWGKKLKLSPLLFPGDSDIFKAIFLYRSINFYCQRIPTKLILSPNLEEKFFYENKEVACRRCSLLLTSLALVLCWCRRCQEKNKKQKRHCWVRQILTEERKELGE